MARTSIWALGAILGIAAAVLLYGGVILIGSGGSPYYLAAGLLTGATAFLLFRRSGLSLKTYGALLIATFLWSLWEAGLDGWALAPRLLGPAILGALLLALPLSKLSGSPSRWWVGAPVLASFAAVALAGILAVSGEVSTNAYTRTVSAAETVPDWRAWGGATGGGRFVSATQINPENVAKLKLAWRYDSDLPLPAYPSLEVTPLADGGRLYACLNAETVVALDQTSGKEVWRYVTPHSDKFDYNDVFGTKCRGVSFYQAPAPLPACSKRIIFASPDGFLRAIDTENGKPCPDFGEGGAADLHAGMESQLPRSRYKVEVLVVSPPAIVNGVVAVGQAVSDLASLDAPSGAIRGFDALTGKPLWSWDAGMEGDPPAYGLTPAAPNAWAPLSGDEELGLVYVPLGNSPPDYFGGMRSPLLDKFATSVVALDAKTGKLRWHFQTVHHDRWDYDIASQPTVADLPGENGVRKALLVGTKTGQIFTLDRATGEPIDPVEERPVPQGGVPGEWSARTQPYTTGFPQLSGAELTEKGMWGITPIDQLWCRITFRKARYQGRYTPITQEPTILFPGTAGGINWGSVSIDKVRGLLIVNTLRFANVGKLIPKKEVEGKAYGGKEGNVVFGMGGTPWAFSQWPFLSPLGVPCQQPPYGVLAAFDLKTRKPVWSKSFGTSAKSGPLGIPTLLPIRMGVPNMGGSIVTASGLTFIGAAQDRKLRAYDTATGRELWSADLPTVAAATPMSFVSTKDGKQYVVIASGGHFGVPGPRASTILAFALP